MARALLIFMALLVAGCSAPPAPTATPQPPAVLPSPPLSLASPDLPPTRLQGIDLASRSTDDLVAGGSYFNNRGEFKQAAQCLAWAVHRGADQRYNLACSLSRAGDLEAAFYWLQQAALEEGVSAAYADDDPDLAGLRSDPRWRQVEPFLQACTEYYSRQGEMRVSLIVPEGYDPGQPITTVVGLHGLGGSQEFVNDFYQPLADRLGLAFVGVSGSHPLGPRKFSWSEDREQDHRHVQKALESMHDKLTVRSGATLLFGFSQGAQMAFELAATHPESYRGALCLSPGRLQKSELPPGGKPNRGQRYLLTAGAEEHPTTLASVDQDASWAKQAGVEVKVKLYPGVSEHAFPADFAEKLPDWLNWLQHK